MFDTPFDHVIGKFGQIQEFLLVGNAVRHIVFQGKVHVKDGQVGGTGLDHPRAAEIARQAVHGRVNFFIHLDKCQVGIGSVIEFQADDGRSVPCFAPDIA
ncbi:hypothetical protein SDC9_200521 [bioreactor metagenome]|uniref:Uncharacterized protein n=1 Tax=bioreactor metagenome TaxID=1076179 RepID=A0A645INF5_9ZZZZ